MLISDSASQGNLKKLLARKQWKKVLSRVMLIAVALVGRVAAALWWARE